MPPTLARRVFFVALAFVTFFLVWHWRYATVKIDRSSLPAKVKISGVLQQVPLRNQIFQKFKIGQIYVTTRPWPIYQYGDYLQLEGELTENLILKHPEITFLKKDQGNYLVKFLFNLRDRLSSVSLDLLPEPQAGLLNGLLLGIQSTASDRFDEQLRCVGLTHAVVVSGYNLNVLAGVVSSATGWLGRGVSFSFSTLALLLFSLMTGFQPPVARALVMSVLCLFGKMIGRGRSSLRLLLIGSYLLVIYDPLLPFSLSFQLSFLATLGLILFEPIIYLIFSKLTSIFSSTKWLSKPVEFVVGELSVTLAAQVLVLPLLTFQFGSLSLISPLSNLLVGWSIPFSMLLGFIMIVAGLVFKPLGWFFSLPSWVSLTWFVRVVELLAAISWADVKVTLGAGVVVGYYLLALIFVIWWTQRGKNSRVC